MNIVDRENPPSTVISLDSIATTVTDNAFSDNIHII